MLLLLGDRFFDPDTKELTDRDGTNLCLRPQSLEVLALLAARLGDVVPREEIFGTIWPDIAVTDDSLTQCIADVRKAIGDTDRAILRTVPKKGYQLVAASEIASPAARKVPAIWFVTAGIGAAALLLIATIFTPELWPFQSVQKAAEARPPSIIVLPFQDLSPGGDNGLFADAMTEDLIVELTRWKEFRVVDRVSSMQFKGTSYDTRAITTKVNANYAVVGSIRRIGDTVRITAQLLDGGSGQNLWAERFDETGKDILQIQDGIVARIEQTLIGNQGAVRADEYRKAWRKATVSLDEYDYYLRGHDKFYEYDKTSVQEAIAIWQRGLRKYPDSGLLTVKLGWGYELCILLNCGHPEATTEAVLTLAQEGMRNENLPSAGHRFGLWLLSSALSRQGKPEEVLQLVDQAISTYPADTEAFVMLTDDLAYVGAFDKVEDLLATVANRDWSRLSARTDAAIGSVAYMKGDCSAAVAKFRNFRALFLYEVMHAGCLAELGQTDEAWAVLDQIRDRFGVRSLADMPIWFHRNTLLKTRVLAQLEPLGWPLPPAKPPSIIVLPFRDLSPDASLTHFADGMSEDLITGLSRWKEFQIVDRATAVSLRNAKLDIREITRRTQTNYALEGSIRRVGDTMRVTAQLVDGATGRNLWANQFDETGTDILALHDGITRRIEQSLIGNFGEVRADEYRKSWTKAQVTLDEYDYMLRGHQVFYEYTPESMVKALDIWREGLNKYPASGLLKIKEGWGRALCNSLDCSYGPFDQDSIYKLAIEGLEDRNLPPSGVRFGLWLLARQAHVAGDGAATLKYSNEIADTYPSDVEGLLWSAMYLAGVDLIDEAVAQLERAGVLDRRPMPVFYEAAAVVYAMAGDCSAAKPYFVENGFPEDMALYAGCLAEWREDDKARSILKDLEAQLGTPADLINFFPHAPKVRARIENQLAKVGWPFASDGLAQNPPSR